ncbi:MAG TPA: TetR family transcriptional regulator [Streptosporangiaceae bacterium]|nr:TetR family transcriptional regulator [Streptosporangiaceae bacterium]
MEDAAGPAPAGRREASKQATRAALAAAAERLFAERGFEQTTVRDIARAASVTERTFYRYFDGKEGLIAEEFSSWLDRLHQAILARPLAESPIDAVRHAMMAIARQAAAERELAPIWLFSGGPSLRTLRRFEPRPLLRLEASIAAAILPRIGSGPATDAAEYQATQGTADDEFAARVIGRVAVAALRSAVIEYRELRATGTIGQRTVEQLLDQAFAVIKAQTAGGDRWR